MTNLPARIAVMAVGLLIILIGVGGAGVFLCVALYAFLCTLISPPLAALAAAGVVFFLSFLVLMIAGGIANTLNRQSRIDSQPSSNFIGSEIGRLLGEDVQGYIARNPKTTLAFAICGGFLIGFSPRFREFLLRILRG